MPGSDKRCCVPECLESGRSHHVLHGFPNPLKEPDRFSLWLKTVGGDNLNVPVDHIYKYRRVCHSHFERKYCCRYNKICNIAHPTLNMPEAPSNTPEKRILPPSVSIQHTYTRPGFEANSDLRYSESDSGPFIVYVTGVKKNTKYRRLKKKGVQGTVRF
ncbi:hypothetical protein K1T71_013273 [Dendrolimus kikuchii]|uniref:Uncharacterized protein n=1 Tax=Dendrolimus kikuchii TaxID=765133 RepID=A0ACC1CHM1_9NEOP|nr:hypothetical protein K1T71_013273 [Dendrolimus kikuchii]